MAKQNDEMTCRVYAIEIHSRWMEAATAGSKNAYERFLYVGSTRKPEVRDRLAEHLRGLPVTGSRAGRAFQRVRAAREAAGLPGQLVEGEDAWLVEELTEECMGKNRAVRREGALARKLERRRGVRAHSDRKRKKPARKATDAGAD